MKEIIIKPGSIIIWKYTDWYSKIYKWFKRKSNKYDSAVICKEQFTLISPLNNFKYDGIEYVILEPKKQYSKAEKQLISSYVVVNDKCIESELATRINIIRPDTVDPSTFTLESLLNNKYYKIVYDSSKEN
jgi:hypothetical protein